MISLATYDTFEDLTGSGFVVVDFFTTTCGPCKVFARILEEIESDLPFLDAVKVNLSDYPRIGQRYDIEAVPTVFFMKDGELLERVVGLMSRDETLAKISEYYYG